MGFGNISGHTRSYGCFRSLPFFIALRKLYTKSRSDLGMVKENAIPYVVDRDRGFLTPADRKYLCGDWSSDSDYPDQVRRNRGNTIEERIRNAFVDFRYLSYVGDCEYVRASINPNYLADLITFVYSESAEGEELIKDAVADGIYTAEQKTSSTDPENRKIIDVSVGIKKEYEPDADEVYRRFQDDGPSELSAEEIGILVRQKDLSREELSQISDSEI